MTRPHRVRALRSLGASRANMLVMSVVYGIFALSMFFQPHRWSATPAYHNLLTIMGARPWGACFAVVAVLLAFATASPARRWPSVVALSAALALTLTWFAAFVVRWLTSASTTPETWASWGVFAFLLIRSLILLGLEEVRVPRRPSGREEPPRG